MGDGWSLMPASQFTTSAGARIPAVTADQMREIDRIALEETGPNLYQMMENAGRSLAMAVLERLGTHAIRVVVLAGTGGNGGGGICAARHLANHGVDVTLVLADETGLGEVPRHQLETYRATHGSEISADAITTVAGHLVVDALVGYNLDGPPRGAVADLIDQVDVTDAQIIALDVPSGIDATTGEVLGPHLSADLTVTLALPKTGLDTPAAGSIELADIGIPIEAYQRAGVDAPERLFGLGYRVSVRPV